MWELVADVGLGCMSGKQGGQEAVRFPVEVGSTPSPNWTDQTRQSPELHLFSRNAERWAHTGTHILFVAQLPDEICTITNFIYEDVEKPQHREGEPLVQGHTAEGATQNSRPAFGSSTHNGCDGS